jgi:acetylornithine deacetylase/succinyl-diaminopimelate desuccinylase-like protein
MSHQALREAVAGLMPQAWEDLQRLVAIPSVADPRQFPAQRCVEAAEWVRDAMAQAGVQECRLIEMPDGHPAVFGHTPAPPGAPTVLLYCHYDVQPPLGEEQWISPPFELTQRDGRWYGRGAADCKGNVVAHLTALRALAGADGLDGFPVGIKLIAEGAEEQGTGGLEQFVPQARELLAADVVIVGDTGNFAVGVPTVTSTLRGMASVVVSVRTLASAMHSGMFGGPAPDALIALTRMIATLHDERGNVSIAGLAHEGRWSGIDYPQRQFRADAHVLEGVELIGDGSISEMLWARPSVNVLGIDCPPVAGSTASLQPRARARVSLRVPPGMDPVAAQDALVAHLEAVAPWGARVEIERDLVAAPFAASTDGPAYARMAQAMRLAFGVEMTTEGQGGSIPLCSVLAQTFPEAEIILMGVEEPQCLIHAPNESVDPGEIERIALAEALFLRACGDLGAARGS